MATYPSRPGLRVEVRANERSVAIPQEPITQSLLIIGTAVDGPTEAVYPVSQIDAVESIYGPVVRQQALGDVTAEYNPIQPAFNNNWVTLGASMAYESGCRNIRVYRLGGTNKSYLYVNGYNRVISDRTVTSSTTGNSVALDYGAVPDSNADADFRTTVVGAADTTLVTISSTLIAEQMLRIVDWYVYDLTTGNEYQINDVIDSSSLHVSENATIANGASIALYPKGMYSVIGEDGTIYNPANFAISTGSTTVAATICLINSNVNGLTSFGGGYPTAGDTVYVSYYMTPDNNHVIKLEALYGNDYTNGRGTFGATTQDGAWVAIQTGATMATMALWKPSYKGGKLDGNNIPVTAMTIEMHKFSNYQQLIQAINDHPNNNFINATMVGPGTGTHEASWNGADLELNQLTTGSSGLAAIPSGNSGNLATKHLITGFAATGLAGGDSDTDWSDQRIYDELTRADTGVFSLLEGDDSSVVVVPQVYLDNSNIDFATKLGEFMYSRQRIGLPGQAVIGCRPKRNTELSAAKINTHVQNLTSGATTPGSRMLTGFVQTYDGNDVDLGTWLVCLAGPDVWCRHEQLGRFSTSPAVQYAAKITSVQPHMGLTGQPIAGVAGLVWQYTPSQKELLRAGVGIEGDRGAPYVVLNQMNGLVLSDIDNTAARRSNQFSVIPTVRIVHDAINGIRAIGSPYIGRMNTEYNRASMKQNFESYLEAMAQNGALNGSKDEGYTVYVDADVIDQAMNRVIVRLHLRPAREILFIENIITIT